MKTIPFFLELHDSNSTLELTSNHFDDAENNVLSENVNEIEDHPLFLSIRKGFGQEESCFSLNVEMAEQLAKELIKAVNFLKE